MCRGLLRRVHLNDVLEKGGHRRRATRRCAGEPHARGREPRLLVPALRRDAACAAETLGIDYLGQTFSELVSYVPSVIAAVVIVILGIVLGDLVAALIGASTAKLHGGPMLARIGKGGVVVLAVFMSLQELGVATDIVTTAFAIVFGAVALALALSFGLGNRDLAGEVTRAWYERWKDEREAIAREQATEERDDSRQG